MGGIEREVKKEGIVLHLTNHPSRMVRNPVRKVKILLRSDGQGVPVLRKSDGVVIAARAFQDSIKPVKSRGNWAWDIRAYRRASSPPGHGHSRRPHAICRSSRCDTPRLSALRPG